MSLPGLGIFTLDKSVVLPEEHDRTLLSMPNAVQFQNANIPSADKDLISFICENTGKIRPWLFLIWNPISTWALKC
jgi:hypothetical protein